MEFKDLIGKTMLSVVNKDNDELIFTTDNNEQYKLYHIRDCCESVSIEDVNGDLADLVGSPILNAVESCRNDFDTTGSYESVTWTFYRISTIKGTVVIRWIGESSGNYSESVDFVKYQ